MAAPADWNSPSCSKLWLYNLHYFDDLGAEGLEARANWHRVLLERWTKENPSGEGNGWEPYPLSLRIVNWIKWALRGGELSPILVHSLATQVRYLSSQLEYHLLGNHLLANAKALIFAGAFYNGSEADRWLSVGLEVLQRQLKEQFLADGGHFERSPMYHSILTEDLLDLVQLRQLYSQELRKSDLDTLHSIDPLLMLSWLRTVTHPDGEIAFFNDAAAGIACRITELEEYAHILGVTGTSQCCSNLVYLEDSGYLRLQNDPVVLLFDAGHLGPDYLPAHAHADTLSFELSLGGSRVLVNSGTSTYTGPLRQWQRGTAAHNTVTIDEMDSSEVWGSFRVARRARPFDIRAEEDCISASHDGYRRLSGSPIHRRTCKLLSDQLQIQDSIEGTGRHRVALHFHAAPGLEIERSDGQWLLYRGGNLVARMHCPEGTRSEVVDTKYYPEFGLAVLNKSLIIHWDGVLPFRGETVISWGNRRVDRQHVII